MRYNVLRMGNFKCALCGNSPAVDPSCRLHIDHVVPFSKGGRTVEGNLRVLCADCNVGKADKV
jgi:5-methylcytosine-specific restriction endonuclease McrA